MKRGYKDKNNFKYQKQSNPKECNDIFKVLKEEKKKKTVKLEFHIWEQNLQKRVKR